MYSLSAAILYCEKSKYKLVFKKFSMGEEETQEEEFGDNVTFEYQELREERSRNTAIDHAMMVIFFAGAGYFYKEDQYLLAMYFVVVAILIDRKLTYFNNERAKRMKKIEDYLGIENLSLIDTDSWRWWGLIKERDIKKIVMKFPIHWYFIITGLLLVILGFGNFMKDLRGLF